MYLVFSTDLLDRTDFWVNEGWDYGQFTKRSLYVKQPNFRRALYVHAHHKIWGAGNPEIAFTEGVSTKHLSHIYVEKGMKQAAVNYLRKKLGSYEIDFDALVVEHE